MFVAVLSNIAKGNHLDILYLDTEIDETIKKARGEFEAATVPGLIYLKEDGSYEKVDTEEDTESLQLWLNERSK